MKRVELTLVKCSEKLPEKDGQYTVVDLWRNSVFSVNTLNYTVEYGWNTSRYTDGTASNENALHFEDAEKYPDHYWAVSTVITEDDDE